MSASFVCPNDPILPLNVSVAMHDSIGSIFGNVQRDRRKQDDFPSMISRSTTAFALADIGTSRTESGQYGTCVLSQTEEHGAKFVNILNVRLDRDGSVVRDDLEALRQISSEICILMRIGKSISIGGIEGIMYSSSTSGIDPSSSGIFGFSATASLTQSMSLSTYLRSDFAVEHRKNIIHASREFYSLFWQLVGAVEWIHKKGILHGNIKSDDSVRVVVTDFALSGKQYAHEEKSGDSPLPGHRARIVLSGFHLASFMTRPMSRGWRPESESVKEDETGPLNVESGESALRCCNPAFQSPLIRDLATTMSMEGLRCWKDPMLINSPQHPPQSISQLSDPQQKLKKMTSAAGKAYYMTVDEKKQKSGLTRFYMDSEMPYSLHTALANVVYASPAYSENQSKITNIVIGGIYDPARNSDSIIPFPLEGSAADDSSKLERHLSSLQFHRHSRVTTNYKRYFNSFALPSTPDEYLYFGSRQVPMSAGSTTAASFRLHRERLSGKFTEESLLSPSSRSQPTVLDPSRLSIYPATSDNWAVGLIGLEMMCLGYRIWGEDGSDASVAESSVTGNVVRHLLLDSDSDLDALEWNNDLAANWLRQELDAMSFDWRDIVRRKLILKDRAIDPTFVSDAPEGGSKYFPYSEEKLFTSSGFLSLNGKDLISLPLLSTHGDFSTGFPNLDQIALTRLAKSYPRAGALEWPEIPECIRGNSTVQSVLFDSIRKKIRSFPVGAFALQAIAGLLTPPTDIYQRNDSLKSIRQAMLRDMRELELPQHWITAIDPLKSSNLEDNKDVDEIAFLDSLRSNSTSEAAHEFDDRMPGEIGQGSIGDMIDFGLPAVEYLRNLFRLASDSVKTHNKSVRSYSIDLLASIARGAISQRCLHPLSEICSYKPDRPIFLSLPWSIRAAKVFLEISDSLLTHEYEEEKVAASKNERPGTAQRPGTASSTKTKTISSGCEIALNNTELFIRAAMSLATAFLTPVTLRLVDSHPQRNGACSECCYSLKNNRITPTTRSIDICAREIIAMCKLSLARVFELRGENAQFHKTIASALELMTHHHEDLQLPTQLMDGKVSNGRLESKSDEKEEEYEGDKFVLPSIGTISSAKIFQKISEYYDSPDRLNLGLSWKYMQVVLDIRKSIFGENHLCTLSAILKLSELHRRNGSLTLAKQHADSAMALATSLFGLKTDKNVGKLQIATAQHALARVCKDMKLYDIALRNILDACRIRTLVLEKDDLVFADYVATHAAIIEARNEYSQALTLLKQCLGIRRRILGDTNAITANTYISLGTAQVRMTLFNEALESFSSAMSAREKIYGQISHQVAAVLNYKGVLYQLQGRLSDALHIYGKVLAVRKIVFEGPHYDTGMVLLSIGNVYHSFMQSLIKSGPMTPELKAQILTVARDSKGAFEQGISQLRDSFTIGRQNPNIVLSMFQLAGIHEYMAEKGVMHSKERLKRFGKESALLEEETLYGRPTIVAQGALVIMEEAFDIIDKAPFVSEEEDIYMFSDVDEGEEDAIVVAIALEEANRRACKVPTFEVRKKKMDVSEWVSDENDIVESARIDLRNANERKLGTTKGSVKIIKHPHALDVLIFLGMLRKDAKLDEDALEPLMLAENILRIVHDYNHPRLFDAMVELAMLYEKTGNFRASLNCLKRLLRGLRKNINPEIVSTEPSVPTLTKKKSFGGDEIINADTEEIGTVLFHIGRLQQNMEFHEIAVDSFFKSFLAREKYLGFNSGEVGHTLLYMSGSLKHMSGQNKIQQARDMQTNALNIIKNVYGENHPETLEAMATVIKKKKKWGIFG